MSERKRRPRRGKPGDLNALKRELWHAIMAAADLLDHTDAQTRLRAIHALAQSAAAYRAVYLDSDLEARIVALETRAEKGNTS